MRERTGTRDPLGHQGSVEKRKALGPLLHAPMLVEDLEPTVDELLSDRPQGVVSGLDDARPDGPQGIVNNPFRRLVQWGELLLRSHRFRRERRIPAHLAMEE